MPSLRDIADDIPIIAQHLLIKIVESYGGNQVNLSECAIEKLKDCRLLGNVRELRNTLERAFTLCNGSEIKAEDLHIKEKVALPEPLSSTLQRYLSPITLKMSRNKQYEKRL